MKVGDRILWSASSHDERELRDGFVTKLVKDLCWVDNHHHAEDCIYVAFTWPAEYEKELRAVLQERYRLKKQYDDSMKLI